MGGRRGRWLFALLLLIGAALAVGSWRGRGRSELARVAAEAGADLRDALKAETEVLRRYAYEPWPYWRGYPDYSWWQDRRTYFVHPPAPQPQPAPPSQVHAGAVSPAPGAAVSKPLPAPPPGKAAPAPLQRIRRRAPPL